MENTSLGKCCICERENETVRNVITLHKKLPEGETKGGWGCFVCGVAAMGAVAVLCDECLHKNFDKKVEIKFACLGYPGENRRIELEKLTEDFSHDESKHPEIEQANSTTAKTDAQNFDDWDFIECRRCRKVVAITDGKCSVCGETICIICGCTESAACEGGCEWIEENICSTCAFL